MQDGVSLERCRKLLDQLYNCTQAIMEYRLVQDYGDYLAKNLNILKQPPSRKEELKELLFHKGKILWTEISDRIREEERKLAYAERCETERPQRPWMMNAMEIAKLIDVSEDQIIWEVHEYARRNRICHNGIDSLITAQDWTGTAKMILKDIKTLNLVYGKQIPANRERMRSAINRLRD